LACLARWNLGTDLNEFVFRYNRRFYRISLEVFSFVSRSIQTHFAGRRSQSPSPSQKSINGDRPAQCLRQRGLARTDWLFLWGRVATAEAGAIDPRVVAVANLDGWLSGRAAFGTLDKPYLVILAGNIVFTGAATTPIP